MKHKALRFSSILAGIAFLAVFFGAAIYNTPTSEAISALDFKAGNIIDDGVFYNKNTMTVAEIQAHLNRYMPACDTWGTGAVGSGRYINGKAVPASTTRAEYARQMRAAGNTRYHEPPYVCVQNYYENPTTHETLFETKNVIKDGMISAAQIIYNASQKYGINPQVLLVLLKKESYVWGDNWPLKNEYNTVMGYACPDTAPCDSKYFGFYNQVEMAAWQLNYYKEHIYSYNYRPYATNSILYSPTTSCGRKSVYLENLATTSLYIYTPYTPNDAALRNYPGTATCGSYGNRNFFMYFSEWFGDTHGFNAAKRTIPDYDYKILSTDKTKSLHISGDSDKAGSSIVADNLSNGSNIFSFRKNTDNSYTIINSFSKLALDIPYANATVGTKIQQWTNNGSNAQKWYIYSDGFSNYYISSVLAPSYVLSISKNNDIVLDVYGSQNSTPLKLIPVIKEKIPNNNYTIESLLKKDLLLDLYHNNPNENTNIDVNLANNTTAQTFSISLDSDSSSYIIKSNHGTILSIDSEKPQNGSNIVVSSDKKLCSQRFLILKNNSNNSHVFYSLCDLSYAIDIVNASTANQTNVQLWNANGSNAQAWLLNIDKSGEESTVSDPDNTPTTKASEDSVQALDNTSPTTPESPLVKDGNYIIHSAIKDNYVIDVAYAGKMNGTNINTWSKNSTAAQIFNIKYNSRNDTYQIINPNSGRAIDLSGATTRNSSNIHIWSINDTCAQYWKINKTNNAHYRISSSCDESFVLDVAWAGSSNGTNIQLYKSNNTLAQEWWFEAM